MKIKWTKDQVFHEALKFEFRNDFKNNSYNAYCAARRHKWLNDVCKHMKNGKLFWTKEKVIEIARKHETRNSFIINDSAAYKSASKNKWLKDINFNNNRTSTSDILHTVNKCLFNNKNTGNRFRRLVYVYEFSDNVAYVGLTYNENIRHLQHLNRGPVFKHTEETKLTPVKKIISDGYIDVNCAITLEIETIKRYRDNGWDMLNKLNGGELGGGEIKTLKEKCKKEALKYNYRGEFKKCSPNAYDTARKKKWLDEICSHMLFKYKKKREE